MWDFRSSSHLIPRFGDRPDRSPTRSPRHRITRLPIGASATDAVHQDDVDGQYPQSLMTSRWCPASNMSHWPRLGRGQPPCSCSAHSSTVKCCDTRRDTRLFGYRDTGTCGGVTRRRRPSLMQLLEKMALMLALCLSCSRGAVPPRNLLPRRAAVSLCALPPTFSSTEAEEQVTALISSSPGISRHSKVTVDELQDDLLNYCIAQRTYPDRIVELKLQTEFCAIPCKNQGDLGTFLQACLFAALRTTYPPPVRGAVIPPARTSRAPRLLSLQPVPRANPALARIQSSFAHGPARR